MAKNKGGFKIDFKRGFMADVPGKRKVKGRWNGEENYQYPSIKKPAWNSMVGRFSDYV